MEVPNRTNVWYADSYTRHSCKVLLSVKVSGLGLSQGKKAHQILWFAFMGSSQACPCQVVREEACKNVGKYRRLLYGQTGESCQQEVPCLIQENVKRSQAGQFQKVFAGLA